MKCERARDFFADEWNDSLDEGIRRQLEEHLAGCSACREERASLNRVWKMLARIPSAEPSPDMHPRFYAMLEGYRQGTDQATVPRPRSNFFPLWQNWRQPALQFGFAALLLIFGFAGGYFSRGARNGHEEIAGLREEVHEMRQMVTISLLKQQSASERLKGVSWSAMVSHPDPEFLATLLHTLDRDPNVDVRLAAVDALTRFAGDPMIRNGLVQSLKKQDSPLVQISLIDLLVQLHERQSIDVLKQLTNDSRQNEVVRQRAQWGLQVLS